MIKVKELVEDESQSIEKQLEDYFELNKIHPQNIITIKYQIIQSGDGTHRTCVLVVHR